VVGASDWRGIDVPAFKGLPDNGQPPLQLLTGVALLALQIEDMARERHVLEACIGEMNTRGREVERWLAANEAKSPTGPLRRRGMRCRRSACLQHSVLMVAPTAWW
jgi:hypothetical protein